MKPNPSSWRLSCLDWRERLRDGRSLVPDLPLDQKAADTAVAVFNKLRLADVPGTPKVAEAGGAWFDDIVRAMFGSVDPATKVRMIRELFALVPKKNAKTTYGALMMVTALLLNERPHANYILTAPVQDVTEIAFAAAAGAINLDPVLAKMLHIREHLKTIVHRETKAELQIMTFDPAVLTGQKVSGGALIDELHVVAKMSKAASAIRQLRGGMLPFPEAFLAFITTQSEDAPSGVFDAELTKAREIRDGKRQGSMLPVLYEFPRELQEKPDEWQNPKNWPMVTPNAGRSVSMPRLVELFNEAKDTGEGELRAWASQHLNVEIGLALHAGRWAGADFWEAASLPRFTLTQLIEQCDVLTLGIDGGGLDDFLGFAAVGRLKDSPREWRSWVHAWAHRSVLERRKSEAARFADFVADGDLTIVESFDCKPGDVPQDVREVGELVQQCEASGKLVNIGVDVYALGAVLDVIEGIVNDPDRVVAVPQGWKLVRAIKTTERRLAEVGLRPCHQPMMKWCVGNAKAEPKGNAIAITKQAAGTAKIDPLMALFNAVELMAMNPQPQTPQLIV